MCAILLRCVQIWYFYRTLFRGLLFSGHSVQAHKHESLSTRARRRDTCLSTTVRDGAGELQLVAIIYGGSPDTRRVANGHTATASMKVRQETWEKVRRHGMTTHVFMNVQRRRRRNRSLQEPPAAWSTTRSTRLSSRSWRNQRLTGPKQKTVTETTTRKDDHSFHGQHRRKWGRSRLRRTINRRFEPAVCLANEVRFPPISVPADYRRLNGSTCLLNKLGLS